MITLAIPNFNRCEMVMDSIEIGLENELITEIVINDDHSEDSIFGKLKQRIDILNNKKIKLFRNDSNLMAFKNKIETIRKCTNNWVILLDSDNVLTYDYLSSIPTNLDKETFYLPSHAICKNDVLDYRCFSNLTIDKDLYNIWIKSEDVKITCLLNTGNYLINKDTYLNAVNDPDIEEPFAVDVFYLIFLCFKNIENFNLKIVDKMKYYHRLHDGSKIDECYSYYISNAQNSQIFLNYLKKKK